MDEQEGLEDVRSTLVDIVASGGHARPGPVHMTYVGSEFARRKKVAFESYLNVLAVQNQIAVPISARKMIPFIESYCADLFDLKREPVGSETIVLKPQDGDATVGIVVHPNHKYQKAIWAAFIRPLPDDYRRFINMDTRGFSDVKRKPLGGVWVEIPRALLTPTPIDQPVPGPLVQARISEWATANGLNIESLVDQAPSASFNRPKMNDLLQIIASLPPELAARWTIPSDVLLYLMSGGSPE